MPNLIGSLALPPDPFRFPTFSTAAVQEVLLKGHGAGRKLNRGPIAAPATGQCAMPLPAPHRDPNSTLYPTPLSGLRNFATV